MTSLETHQIPISVSVLSSSDQFLNEEKRKQLLQSLTGTAKTKATAQIHATKLGNPRLVRQLNLPLTSSSDISVPTLESVGLEVYFEGNRLGERQVLFKTSLPGELQAKISTESIVDRFLEYLEKKHQIISLNESDRHVELFVPGESLPNFDELWKKFLKEVAFSSHGIRRYELPGLMQTFVAMLKSVTLSGRGFSTLEIPVITRDQADMLAAWYYAVWRDAGKRQTERQKKTDALYRALEDDDLKEKDRKSKTKEIADKEAMQAKEAKKYQELFHKSLSKILSEYKTLYADLKETDTQLQQQDLSKKDKSKLTKQRKKITDKLFFSEEFIEHKSHLLEKTEGDPFQFIKQDQEDNPQYFSQIATIAKGFSKTASDQINGTRGDIFAKCLIEMYRLLELKEEDFEPFPTPVLTDKIVPPRSRSPGDDHKEFCYSCGVSLDPKKAKWQVLRFVFERPSQRRQSASGEGRPHICDACSLFAFASPLKVTDESIIVKLEAKDQQESTRQKLKDYLRMLTCKDMNLSSGKYLVLASDKTKTGDAASAKLGQVQYAIAKISSLFSIEVLQDFQFSLITQASEPIVLANRHLIFTKGLMEAYGLKIIEGGKDINLKLGDAIRYVQNDSPYLAEYSTVRHTTFALKSEQKIGLNKTHQLYWHALEKQMNSNKHFAKRAKLYRDVAALTGLTAAFVGSMESSLKSQKTKEDYQREMSKLIEKVDDPNFFGYYATLGVETVVQARLWKNPDNYFIYQQTQDLLNMLGQADREQEKDGKIWLQLYIDDVANAYAHFADDTQYSADKDWKELTYQLKLSLYTRFPELVRKSKNSGEN